MPNVPPISGYNKKGFFFFRSLEDVFGILEMARISKKAVIIGGGLLGIECAKALRDKGSLAYSILKVVGVRLMSAGRIHEDADNQVFFYKDAENYRKAVLKGERLEGFILYGSLEGSERF